MGKPISWFDGLSADDKNFIIAYWETKDSMLAWDAQKQQDEINKPRGSKRGS